MPVWEDIFGHVLSALQEAFPQHTWDPNKPAYSDSKLKPVDYNSSPVLQFGSAAAQVIDPTSGAATDIFKSTMPVLDNKSIPLPGMPGYTPGYNRIHT